MSMLTYMVTNESTYETSALKGKLLCTPQDSVDILQFRLET